VPGGQQQPFLLRSQAPPRAPRQRGRQHQRRSTRAPMHAGAAAAGAPPRPRLHGLAQLEGQVLGRQGHADDAPAAAADVQPGGRVGRGRRRAAARVQRARQACTGCSVAAAARARALRRALAGVRSCTLRRRARMRAPLRSRQRVAHAHALMHGRVQMPALSSSW